MKLVYKKLEKKKIKAVVIDNIGGLYLPIALNLSKYFDVYYHSITQSPFPRMSYCEVGTGLEGITIITDFWSNINNFDVFIFPDIYCKDWAFYLRSIGKKVWGGSPSEDLEINRKFFKECLSSNKMDVAPTKYIMGIKALGLYLKNISDKWIKVSYYRGDMETFHHINWRQSEVWLNSLSNSLGPLGEELEFMVEDSIDSIAEIGGDGYVVNGENPDSFLWGLEVKDLGYLGKASKYSDMPQPITQIYEQFRPTLQKYNDTGFYSTEIRVGEDGKNYFTDPCMRAGSPPSNVYMEMITNWDEIIIGGVNGEVVEPRFKGAYGVEIILKSGECQTEYMPVSFDEKYKDNIKLKGNFILNGRNYVIPLNQAGIHMEEFGSVVVIGDNVDKIVNEAIDIANSIDCYGLNFAENALDKAKESLNRVEQSLNVKF